MTGLKHGVSAVTKEFDDVGVLEQFSVCLQYSRHDDQIAFWYAPATGHNVTFRSFEVIEFFLYLVIYSFNSDATANSR